MTLSDPWIRYGRKSASGSEMNNSDHTFGRTKNFFFGLKYLKSFHEDPGSGMETVRMRDPGWNKVGSGINIPNPQHCQIIIKDFQYFNPQKKQMVSKL
jgi:hypothetical protein